jgi:hypothetical protein
MPRFVRDLFTGEVVEREFETEDGRAIIGRTTVPEGAVEGGHVSPWNRPWESKSLAVHPAQVAQFNELAQKNGTGAFYKPDGTLQCESRGARNREMRARNVKDGDAGFGDYAGQ